MTLPIKKGSCIGTDSMVFQLLLSLSLRLFLDISVYSMIALVALSMDLTFLFFPVEVSEWAGCFPLVLLHCPISAGEGEGQLLHIIWTIGFNTDMYSLRAGTMLEEDDKNCGMTKEDEAVSASSICNARRSLKGN
nr:hypothetical protein CFP56_27768 [Quercus suber]